MRRLPDANTGNSAGLAEIEGFLELWFRTKADFNVASCLHYNYFRDYDPAVGRYVESYPIGLKGRDQYVWICVWQPYAIH